MNATKHLHSADGYPLPSNPAQNAAGAPLLEIMEESKPDFGFEVTIRKHIKLGSSLGSSAASAAGAVIAANLFTGPPLTGARLPPCASRLLIYEQHDC